ncbi:MAG: hypothetical protein U0031_20585, partial [Thermomicrobiales bacterium]
MPLLQDIVLNGVPYSVVPGTWKKRNAPAAGGDLPRDVKRLSLGPFGRGQRQAIDTKSPRGSAGWDSVGVGSCFDGQGVEPWPSLTTNTDTMTDLPTPTLRAHGIIVADAAYVGVGRRIYKSVSLTNSNWANFTVHADLGAGVVISGMTAFQDDMLVFKGNGADIVRVNASTGAITTWRLGEKATVGQAYKSQLIYAPKVANNQEELRLSNTKWNGNAVTHVRYLDSPIVRMALFNGKVAIATKTSLFLLGGDPYPGEADDASVPADTSKAPAWTDDPEPLMTHGSYVEDDDFVFLTTYRGRLYTWLGGRVAEFDDSQEEARWRRTGPEGLTCYGGIVGADHLIVAIQGRFGNREVWAFDGDGWWQLVSTGTVNPLRVWPCPLGGAGARDFVVFRDNNATYDLVRTKWRSTSLHTYPATGTWLSSLLDAGDPTRNKAWRAVGASFAAPAQRGNSASADTLTVALEYSTDGGATWTQAAATTTNTVGTLTRTLQGTLSAVSGRYLQLRVVWSSIADWAPVLAEVWAEYEALDNAPARRRWELAVDASDRKPRRDGQLAANTGRADIQALWAAWAGGAALTFKDIDNDTDAVDYTVRIEAIEEKAAKPGDQARWGESQIALTLAEV